MPAHRPGEGSAADDVYALGVTILWCVLGGAVPGWADEPALLKRKLGMGSLAALAGTARLSPGLTDLLRGMLAEDPDHRPAAALLLDVEQARSRRVATRPAARAQRPIEIAGMQIWFPRELAWALGASPDQAAMLLRQGAIGAWLRRVLGDAPLAVRVDEAVARGEMAGDGAARCRRWCAVPWRRWTRWRRWSGVAMPCSRTASGLHWRMPS